MCPVHIHVWVHLSSSQSFFCLTLVLDLGCLAAFSTSSWAPRFWFYINPETRSSQRSLHSDLLILICVSLFQQMMNVMRVTVYEGLSGVSDSHEDYQ